MAKTRTALLTKLGSAILLAIVTTGCTTSGSKAFNDKALANGLVKADIVTENFDLTAYVNDTAKQNTASTLRIYLDGDGRPFFRRRYINLDPTSANAVSLKLLLSDSSAAILLGRPCYHQLVRKRACKDVKWWTSHRYSEEVVSAMSDAILQLYNRYNKPKLELVGLSGGGTIALVLAQRLSVINSVVLINPNLNIDAWTEHHGYTPLSGSINPYTNPTLPDQTRFTIWIGEQDKNILARHWLDRFSSQDNVRVKKFPDNNHLCCWLGPWRTYLSNSGIHLNSSNAK